MAPPAAGTGAVRFDASTDHYTSTTNLPAAGSTFTITCWVRVDTARSFETVFSFDGSGGYALSLTSDGTQWYLWDEAYATISGPTRTVGTWYKVAVVVNGANWSLGMATAAGTATLTTADRGNISAPTRLRIGANTFVADEWLNGRVAAFKMWNAALTQTEINAELAQYAPVRTSNLARYYPFITAPGTTDEGPNGWNLTAGSTATATTDGPGIDTGGAATGALSAVGPAATADSVTGTARATGTATSTSPATVASIAGDVRTTGTVSATTGAATASAAGTTYVAGTLSAATGAVVGAATGTATATGTTSAAAPAATAALAGATTTTGTAAGTTPAAVAALTGATSTSGALTGSAPPVTGSFTGSAGNNTLTAVAPAPSAALAGTTTTSGAVTGQAAAATATAAGAATTTGSVTGEAPAPAAALTGAAAATGTLAASTPAPVAALETVFHPHAPAPTQVVVDAPSGLVLAPAAPVAVVEAPQTGAVQIATSPRDLVGVTAPAAFGQTVVLERSGLVQLTAAPTDVVDVVVEAASGSVTVT